ncbi:uncharacterized protein [Argopecten irradians]|uniref:uncharacterized protein n=1 Tax=Argopecten irradians TaxID=31199 RepID=UPI003711710F
MGLSAAERMRRYRQRIKNDSQAYEQYKQKEKGRYRKRKRNGDIKLIDDCNDREKRQRRKLWRKEKRQQRKEEKKRLAENAPIIQNTPPNSPTHSNNSNSHKKHTGINIRKRNMKKMKKEFEKVKEELKAEKRRSDKYRKRYQRILEKTSSKNSPRKKVDTMLKGKILDAKQKKEILFSSVVVKNIQQKMKVLKSERQRQMVSKLMSCELLKKYRLMHLAKECNISYKRLRANNARATDKFERKKQRNAIPAETRRKVRDFLERDSSSRLMPGKRDTKTKHGLKKQKRLLNDSLLNLHKKFVTEYPQNKLSYQMFCRLRPFWVVNPSCDARDTCVCKLHANIQFKLNRLIEEKVINKKSINEYCQSLCCDEISKECMYRECKSCSEKVLSSNEGMFDEGKQVWIYGWKNKIEERECVKANGEKNKITVHITVKEKQHYTLRNLLDETIMDFNKRICRHEYNMHHQLEQIRRLKENLSPNECIIHIDFSENFACKLTDEVQSMHFGASRNQVSLHTGVFYEYSKKPSSFCTMSACTRHDPTAIWAHLDPILREIRETNQNIDTVHFVSDGPTTQYRSKKNFYLMKDRVHRSYGFQTATWNFTEAGHGKGAPDGVGGLVKRKADQAVAYGKDITDVHDMYHVLTGEQIDVKLIVVEESDINEISRTLPDNVKPVPGTMKIHQVLTAIDSSHITVRDLSCFCKKPLRCSCFTPKSVPIEVNVESNVVSQAVVERVETTVTEASSENTNTNTVNDESLTHPEQQREVNGKAPVLRSIPADGVDVDAIGEWCVVSYEGKAFPGIILDVDENDIEVKVMHRIGVNRFFWPLIEDVLWYENSDVITMIPQPLPVTKRHVQVSPDIWKEISKKYD